MPPQDGAEIERYMANLEMFINDTSLSDLDPLIKMAIIHHQFESIHPFYDGNGRTGRFLTSLYLSKSFSIYTAYALSNGCRLTHRKYLDLFHRTNGFSNYGELNFAIEAFLDILIAGQDFILEDLEEKASALRQAGERIDEHFSPDATLAKNILFLFYQQHLFDNGTLEKNALAPLLKEAFKDNSSKSKISNCLNALETKGYLTKVKQKPLTYGFNEARFYSTY